MFIAAQFTIAKLWKQPRCPTTDVWITKMWYLYTMEFYAAMKKNEILSFAVKWMELENIILSEVSLAQKTKNRMFSLICRASTTRGLDFDHMIKRETPKKLDSICCPQCRETNADPLKQLRPIGEGDQELVKMLVREELI
jgi:hypothetical protein